MINQTAALQGRQCAEQESETDRGHERGAGQLERDSAGAA